MAAALRGGECRTFLLCGCCRWPESHIPKKLPEVLQITKQMLELLKSLLWSFKLHSENNPKAMQGAERPRSPPPAPRHTHTHHSGAGQDQARSGQFPSKVRQDPARQPLSLCRARPGWEWHPSPSRPQSSRTAPPCKIPCGLAENTDSLGQGHPQAPCHLRNLALPGLLGVTPSTPTVTFRTGSLHR